MAQNKRTIKVYSPQFEKLKREHEKISNRKPVFKMSKQTKRKIKAIVAASALLLGGIKTAQTVFAQSPESVPKIEEKLTIAIANADSEITVDGEKYKIDSNSFVVVSDRNALAFDGNGNLHRGSVSNSDVKEILTMTEDEMSAYNVYQVIAEDGANVRSSGTIEDGNIISSVGYQDYVLGCSPTTDEYDSEWISTISVNGDNLYQGYIREDLIQEVGDFNLLYDNANEVLMKVDTSKDGNINLNLRTQPENFDKRCIVTTIPNGSIVRIIGQTISENNKSWTQIEYESKNSSTLQGWVASDYLVPYLEQNQEQSQKPNGFFQECVEKNTMNIHTNATGNVTGIDISSISPNALRELLQTGIPEDVSSAFGDVDTSKLAGDINFVYIKIGASPYGNGDFRPLDYTSYEEQVKICEELGVPYGFYYYSTSTTVEEANIELEHITKKMEDLQDKFDLKNNKLDMVVDIELAGTNDRQYRGNIQEQTEAKAALINGIQEAGISDNVLIYGPMRVMKPDLDQIFSLSDLHSMLSNPDNVNLWLCARANENGQLPSSFESQVEYAKEHGFDTVVTQVVLDANVTGRIDINNMSLEHYQDLIQPTIELTQTDDYER